QSFNPKFYTGYLASGAIIFVLVLGTSRVVAARDLSTAGAHATTATVSNLGFLGPPLMLAFFGERGAGPLAMAILAEVMVLLSVGSVLMGANGGPKSGIGSLILRGDDARSAENQHKDDRARCEVAGVEVGIAGLTKWLTRDEAQKEGWERKAKREGV
ncbi:MAG TPA: hypothetical protein VF760_09455, partial [Xanthobacteraceae bacterium]